MCKWISESLVSTPNTPCQLLSGPAKVFRLEAIRADFKRAWQERDYAVIVAVADNIPTNVLEEDPKLLMWFDQAVTRMAGE